MRLRPSGLIDRDSTPGLSRGALKARFHVMSMLRKFIEVFELPPAPPASTDREHSRIARDVVADRSHGNIPLQQGRYYTKEDVEAEYERVRGIDFTTAKDEG